MQISRTQNQPNFKGKTINARKIIKRVKAEDAPAAKVLEEQIAAMRKIGSEKTTQYQIYYAGKKTDTIYNRPGRPFVLETIVNTKDLGHCKGFKAMSFNLTVDEIAKKAQEVVLEAIEKQSEAAQKSVLEQPKGLWERFSSLFKS